MEIEFHLTIEEANTILNALGDKPYSAVNGIITKMKMQAQPQVQQAEAQASNEGVQSESVKEPEAA